MISDSRSEEKIFFVKGGGILKNLHYVIEKNKSLEGDVALRIRNA